MQTDQRELGGREGLLRRVHMRVHLNPLLLFFFPFEGFRLSARGDGGLTLNLSPSSSRRRPGPSRQLWLRPEDPA